VTYTYASAGHQHTVLLCNDGTAATVGDHGWPECNVDLPDEGNTYVQAAAGWQNTTLLCSDGSVKRMRRERGNGMFNFPDPPHGHSWMHVTTGLHHAVLLRDDGTAEAFGINEHGECNVPALEAGVVYIPVEADLVVQLFLERITHGAIAKCLNLSGEEMLSWHLDESKFSLSMLRCVADALQQGSRRLRVVLPGQGLLSPKLTCASFFSSPASDPQQWLNAAAASMLSVCATVD